MALKGESSLFTSEKPAARGHGSFNFFKLDRLSVKDQSKKAVIFVFLWPNTVFDCSPPFFCFKG